VEENKAKISCPIFQKQEFFIKDLTDSVNMAKNVQEKAGFAERIGEEADVLLSCVDHDSKRIDCKHCHFIANLRKKTANLIIKAKKL